MRNELKIGIVIGILIVTGLIVYLVNRGQEQGPAAPLPPTGVSSPAPKPQPSSPTTKLPRTTPIVSPAPAQPATPATSPAPKPTPPVVVVPAPPAALPAPKPPTDEPDDHQPRYHLVKQGETLSTIAESYYGSGRFANVIYQANRNVIRDPDVVQAGWRLRIPYPDEVSSGASAPAATPR